ncbi:hypothetical protein BN7_2129 [Wickerhamomyces ciferrii]|uniref:Uncharacterized protein n=1 Tax=Wickerhamomyces ciferrii (strain ATCC 14091 / BCRC 22168 / CBS 111 / JCM 3599 / NBRC 0793 / NRRL Y-1031 F-60-10) TaxID=1206466 RepID=K0KBZ1_WICCF|nr:uncharacterized protein BN7_2129 [Wickerhamomyces ciferrii]CCH42585.1 hypothetical protein BN7_2129 [Wickerhamomyces ciferrii]
MGNTPSRPSPITIDPESNVQTDGLDSFDYDLEHGSHLSFDNENSYLSRITTKFHHALSFNYKKEKERYIESAHLV